MTSSGMGAGDEVVPGVGVVRGTLDGMIRRGGGEVENHSFSVIDRDIAMI